MANAFVNLCEKFPIFIKPGELIVGDPNGEPGVGKSRLLHEFRRSLQGEPVTWLEGHCVAYGQGTPYLPILDVLRANFQIEDEDNPLQIREKLHQGLRQLDPALTTILPLLAELFGLPAGDESMKHLDPKERRKRTFEAIRALTVAGSQRRPLVVVHEDLHWIDKTSEDYLAFLIDSLPGMPHLVLTTHRPGYALRRADKAYCTQLALDLLTEDETEAMVSALLESQDLPSELLSLIRERAEGNPLFVEELTHSLLENGSIQRKNDHYVLTRKPSEIQVPDTPGDHRGPDGPGRGEFEADHAGGLGDRQGVRLPDPGHHHRDEGRPEGFVAELAGP